MQRTKPYDRMTGPDFLITSVTPVLLKRQTGRLPVSNHLKIQQQRLLIIFSR